MVCGNGGKVLAVQAVTAMQAEIGSCRTTLYLLTGAITHPKYRGQGLFRTLVEYITHEHSLGPQEWFYTFPNRNSARSFKQFSNWTEQRPLRLFVRQLILCRRRMRTCSNHARLAKSKVYADERVESLTFSSAADDFPDTRDLLRVAFPGEIVSTLRSREYLTWRYRQGPIQGYRVECAWHDGRLMGYSVMIQKEIERQSVGLIADLVANGENVATALLNRWIGIGSVLRLRALGYLVGSCNPYHASLRSTGFHGLPSLSPIRTFNCFTFCNPDDRVPTKDTDVSSRWYITWGDTDVV